MKKLMTLAFAGLSWSAAAVAADLPSRKFAAPAPVAPAFTWTGFYIGANAGYAWNESRTRYSYLLADPADLPEFNALGLVPQSLGRNSDGFVGGGQIGYNYQMGQFVLGLEADLQYLDARQQSALVVVASDGAGSTGTFTTVARSRVDWLGTVRARAGFAIDRTLIYATGGLAYGRTTDRSSLNVSVVDIDGSLSGVWAGGKTDTRAGWTIGGGIEYAITQNLTVKGEYLYYDLGETKYLVAGSTANPDDEFFGATARRKTNGSIVRAGLNWKFSAF